MKKIKFLLLAFVTSALVFQTSCRRDSDDPQPPVIIPDLGLIVLNEGSWGGNNGDITLFDFETEAASQDVFRRQNGRHLGDLPSDILIYGSRIFITVGGSSTLEITDLELNEIKQIPLRSENNVARNPRGLASHNGKVYFALFDGYVARLDTTTLEIDDFVQVGQNPENIVIRNNFAYVTNSGGFNSWMETGGDSTVSVIDLTTFQVVDRITVGLNPVSIGMDQSGNIIVGCSETATLPSRAYRIRPDRTVERFANIAPTGFAVNRTTAFAYSSDWNSEGPTQFIEFNTSTGTIVSSSFLDDPSLLTLPNGIAINSQNEDIYVADVVDFSFSAPGKVFVFDRLGEYRFSFETGVAPKRVVVLR